MTLLVAWLAMAALAGCGGNGNASTGSPLDAAAGGVVPIVVSAPADVYPNVHVLPDDIAASAVFDGSSLFFPSSADGVVRPFKAGDVAVSAYGDGFVLTLGSDPNVSGSGPTPQALHPLDNGPTWTRFTASVGSLLDVFRNIDANLSFVVVGQHADVSGTQIAGDTNAGVTFSKATFDFTPTVVFRLTIADGTLSALGTEIDSAVTAEAALLDFAKTARRGRALPRSRRSSRAPPSTSSSGCTRSPRDAGTPSVHSFHGLLRSAHFTRRCPISWTSPRLVALVSLGSLRVAHSAQVLARLCAQYVMMTKGNRFLQGERVERPVDRDGVDSGHIAIAIGHAPGIDARSTKRRCPPSSRRCPRIIASMLSHHRVEVPPSTRRCLHIIG